MCRSTIVAFTAFSHSGYKQRNVGKVLKTYEHLNFCRSQSIALGWLEYNDHFCLSYPIRSYTKEQKSFTRGTHLPSSSLRLQPTPTKNTLHSSSTHSPTPCKWQPPISSPSSLSSLPNHNYLDLLMFNVSSHVPFLLTDHITWLLIIQYEFICSSASDSYKAQEENTSVKPISSQRLPPIQIVRWTSFYLYSLYWFSKKEY